MTQAGLLLEIAGVFLATIIAGIFLERRVGIAVDRFERLFASAATKFENTIPSLEVESVPIKFILTSRVVFSGIVVCIIIGWLNNIAWLFWSGIGLISLDIVVIATLAVPLAEHEFSILAWPFVFVVIVLVMYLLTPPLVVAFGSLRTLRLLSKSLAKRDAPKWMILIAGTIMILAGLILQFIDTL